MDGCAYGVYNAGDVILKYTLEGMLMNVALTNDKEIS